MDEFGDDFDLAAIEVVFAPLAGRRINNDGAAGRFIDFATFILWLLRRFDFGAFGFAVFVNFLLRGEGGIAVEGRVGKITRGRAGVIEDVEPELAVVVADARAAPDDLLELDHRVDETHEYDIATGGRVEAGGEQL